MFLFENVEIVEFYQRRIQIIVDSVLKRFQAFFFDLI